jgi:hypothetical protein
MDCANSLKSIIEGAEMEMKAENKLEKAFAAGQPNAPS